jgi:hypothetical protein
MRAGSESAARRSWDQPVSSRARSPPAKQTRHFYVQKLTRNPEVFGCHPASVWQFFVLDDLPLIETAEAGPFNSRDVHKYIFAAALRLNES